MEPSHAIAALAFAGTGLGVMYFGYRVRTDRGADLVFAPGSEAAPDRLARTGGAATVVAGAVTFAAGVAIAITTPVATEWLLLVGGYATVCLAIGATSWWRLRAR